MSEEQPPTGSEQQQGGQSGNYTPPATQADLDRIIADRLARERSKFGDYEDFKAKAAEFDKVAEASKTEAQRQAEALEATQKELESYKTREQVAQWASEIVKDSAVPSAALKGSTKEELQAHFEVLQPLIGQPPRGPVIPSQGATPDRNAGSTPESEFANFLTNQLEGQSAPS